MIIKVQAMYRAETAILDAEQEELHNETSFVVLPLKVKFLNF